MTLVASLCLLELGCLHLQLFFTISLLAEQTCKLFAFPRACPFPTSSIEGFTYLMKVQTIYFQGVNFVYRNFEKFDRFFYTAVRKF